MKSDGDLRGLLRKHLSPPLELTPVETGGTAGGVPDVYWHDAGRFEHGWIECKWTAGWAVTFRPHQVGWIKRHAAAGVRCAVLVRQTGGDRDVLWCIDGKHVDELDVGGLKLFGSFGSKHAPLGRWEGGPRCWPWPELLPLLMRAPA